MLTEWVSRIGQILERYTGTIRVVDLDLVNASARGLINGEF